MMDGGFYKGDWKDNKRNGYGIFTTEAGETQEGSWVDNKKQDMFLVT